MSFYFVFFFKQKTAYEMRISDWSSDVCSSDLREAHRQRDGEPTRKHIGAERHDIPHTVAGQPAAAERHGLIAFDDQLAEEEMTVHRKEEKGHQAHQALADDRAVTAALRIDHIGQTKSEERRGGKGEGRRVRN